MYIQIPRKSKMLGFFLEFFIPGLGFLYAGGGWTALSIFITDIVIVFFSDVIYAAQIKTSAYITGFTVDPGVAFIISLSAFLYWIFRLVYLMRIISMRNRGMLFDAKDKRAGRNKHNMSYCPRCGEPEVVEKKRVLLDINGREIDGMQDRFYTLVLMTLPMLLPFGSCYTIYAASIAGFPVAVYFAIASLIAPVLIYITGAHSQVKASIRRWFWCQCCHSYWHLDPGEPPPQKNVDPVLHAFGKQRLEEERRRAWEEEQQRAWEEEQRRAEQYKRAYDHYWQQQLKKNK